MNYYFDPRNTKYKKFTVINNKILTNYYRLIIREKSANKTNYFY